MTASPAAAFARESLFDAAQVLYLFAPLLFSALVSAAVLRLDLLPWANRPIDGGVTLAGRRVLGDGKTWRGVLVAVAGCVAGASFQTAFVGARAGALAVIDYTTVNPVLLGGAMGVGAMLGELPNSFVKRRVGVARGGTARGALGIVFYLWDQVDLLTTAWPFLSPWTHADARLVVTSFVIALGLHPLVSLIGYLLGARSSAR
jgi:CDP-2,3-bis-(O-geranylgeranyl)-sn-glycerol synthase